MATAVQKKRSFFYKMFCAGETDAVSSKRVISFIALLVLVALAFMSAFGLCASTDYIYVFAALTGGESLLVTIEKKNKKIKKVKEVMSGKEKEEEVVEG